MASLPAVVCLIVAVWLVKAAYRAAEKDRRVRLAHLALTSAFAASAFAAWSYAESIRVLVALMLLLCIVAMASAALVSVPPRVA